MGKNPGIATCVRCLIPEEDCIAACACLLRRH